MKKKDKSKVTEVTVKGFFRGQLINNETGKIEGDTGWRQNKLSTAGLVNIARLLGGVAGSYIVGYACLGTQTDAVDMAQSVLTGSVNSYRAITTSTSGAATLTLTASFAGTSLATTVNVNAVALHSTNASAGLIALQLFGTNATNGSSSWATNQDFNLTYQLRFGTA